MHELSLTKQPSSVQHARHNEASPGRAPSTSALKGLSYAEGQAALAPVQLKGPGKDGPGKPDPEKPRSRAEKIALFARLLGERQAPDAGPEWQELAASLGDTKLLREVGQQALGGSWAAWDLLAKELLIHGYGGSLLSVEQRQMLLVDLIEPYLDRGQTYFRTHTVLNKQDEAKAPVSSSDKAVGFPAPDAKPVARKKGYLLNLLKGSSQLPEHVAQMDEDIRGRSFFLDGRASDYLSKAEAVRLVEIMQKGHGASMPFAAELLYQLASMRSSDAVAQHMWDAMTGSSQIAREGVKADWSKLGLHERRDLYLFHLTTEILPPKDKITLMDEDIRGNELFKDVGASRLGLTGKERALVSFLHSGAGASLPFGEALIAQLSGWTRDPCSATFAQEARRVGW